MNKNSAPTSKRQSKKSFPDRPKNVRKSTKKRPKIDPKSIKNRLWGPKRAWEATKVLKSYASQNSGPRSGTPKSTKNRKKAVLKITKKSTPPKSYFWAAIFASSAKMTKKTSKMRSIWGPSWGHFWSFFLGIVFLTIFDVFSTKKWKTEKMKKWLPICK